ncbi:DUF58 domain-containing protein [Thalassotalea sp. PLHSN55]|uniref:DUF58 domain-containing protein n=1 Tax=Thalassotalea sp. PLHSN55 TaxID=3435888 RepID=UPI003F868580
MLLTVKSTLTNIIAARVNLWLKKRMPAKNRYQLTSRNIFIFPSKFGFAYLAFLLLLFLLGTNYQNNVILLLTYLLASFFISAMLHSFYNVRGLEVAQLAEVRGFSGQTIAVPIELNSTKARHHFSFSFNNQPKCFQQTIVSGKSSVNATFFATHRGRQSLGRLKVASEYGLGLFTTWTQLDLNIDVIIYPEPKVIKGAFLAENDMQSDNDAAKAMPVNNAKPIKQGDDFYALEPYRLGQPLSHVAWKQVARGQGWLTKQYQQDSADEIWLSLSAMPAADVDTKLSMLCGLILEYDGQGKKFGVKFPRFHIEPEQGAQHLAHCLTELALYQQ